MLGVMCLSKTNDNQSTFENLLWKDSSVSIHHRNIRSFAIETYKIKNNVSTPIRSELFEKRNLNYNLRSQTDFSLQIPEPKVWSIVPLEIRNAISLEEFSAKIKSSRLEKGGFGCVWPTYIK